MKKKFYTAIAIIAFIGLSNASFAQTHQRGDDQTARVENNQFNGGGDHNDHYVNGSRQEDRRDNNKENRRDDRHGDYNTRSERGRSNHEESRCDRRF